MILTLAAACGIVAAAVVFVCLYRFTGVFTLKHTEKRIAQNLDFNDPHWVDTLLELLLPSLKKDFPIYSAFSYADEKSTVTQIYATRASLDDIRSHYQGLLENPYLPEKNNAGVLELSGELNGRKVTAVNYYSEVSHLIRVDLEMSGEYGDMIRHKIMDSFPLEALTVFPEIEVFASGKSTEGYVMYNSNSFATDLYANAPIFSRAYSFGGSMEELKEKINALGERFVKSAVISDGMAEIKRGDWLYQIKALESFSGVKAALIIQAIPKS